MKASKATVLMAAVAAGCALATVQAADRAAPADGEYIAYLQPMNVLVSGTETSGSVRIAIQGDDLSIAIMVTDAPANITHWQHFHGFLDDSRAACPTAAADANGDGVIDLFETEPAAGTTMVPFNDDPAAMDVAHGSYPKASAQGAYTYQKVVSLEALAVAFANAFDGSELDFDRRVVFIHGVRPDADLPQTVASLDPIPADVTVPIASCKIERVQ